MFQGQDRIEEVRNLRLSLSFYWASMAAMSASVYHSSPAGLASGVRMKTREATIEPMPNSRTMDVKADEGTSDRIGERIGGGMWQPGWGHEIVQEAILNLVRRYAARPDEEWPMLFHRILQNGIRDWHRRLKVRSQLTRWFGWEDEEGEHQDAVDHLADPRASTPDRDCESEQLIRLVERAVGRLPLRQKQAFLLRAWEGLDVRDTAEAMGCTEGSVKTHFSRALKTLRQQLGEVLE
jgi:RNA polymerase sigma-70 factor (ECF subfamily)